MQIDAVVKVRHVPKNDSRSAADRFTDLELQETVCDLCGWTYARCSRVAAGCELGIPVPELDAQDFHHDTQA